MMTPAADRATAQYYRDHVFPAAQRLIPEVSWTPEASRFLFAIGRVESGWVARRQMGNGPARSYFQFEKNGVYGLVHHAKTAPILARVAAQMGYNATMTSIHAALEHNDLLAAICARLLVLTIPRKLPDTFKVAFEQYNWAWQPGKPRPEKWPEAWEFSRAVLEDDAHA